MVPVHARGTPYHFRLVHTIVRTFLFAIFGWYWGLNRVLWCCRVFGASIFGYFDFIRFHWFCFGFLCPCFRFLGFTFQLLFPLGVPLILRSLEPMWNSLGTTIWTGACWSNMQAWGVHSKGGMVYCLSLSGIITKALPGCSLGVRELWSLSGSDGSVFGGLTSVLSHHGFRVLSSVIARGQWWCCNGAGRQAQCHKYDFGRWWGFLFCAATICWSILFMPYVLLCCEITPF